jgi:hypothetical protein
VRIRCPHCGRTATAEDRFFLQSADGSVQRTKLACPAGHWLIPQLEPGTSRWTGP